MSSLKTISGNSPFLNQDGLTVTGNIIVDGDIISLGNGGGGSITSITPQITTTLGAVGSITYSNQVGTKLSLLSELQLYSIYMEFSLTSANIAQLGFIIPGIKPTITSTCSNIITGGTFIAPAAINTTPNSNTFSVYDPIAGIPVYAPTYLFTSSLTASGFFWSATPSTFTPTLTGTGTTGVSYGSQQGYYAQVGNICFFTSYISLTYTGASATYLITNLPATPTIDTLVAVNANNGGTWIVAPSVLSIAHPNAYGSFINTNTGTAIALSGSGSLSFSLSGAIITAGASSFYPTFQAAPSSGTWIESSTSYTASYVTSSGVTCFNITYSGTVTATTTRLTLTGLPVNPTGKTIFSSISSNLGNVDCFVWDGTYLSPYDSTNTISSFSLAAATVLIQISGYYY